MADSFPAGLRDAMKESVSTNLLTSRSALLVYLVLVTLTVLTWLIGMSGVEALWVSLLVFAMVLFKVHLIGDYFMQLKQVRGIWGLVIVIWLSITAILVSAAYIFSAS
ncbi:cytochrome C oxidase subunit IV family protein [Solemya velum gill symbiont]|uniref:cytochrome C oxidase subunit IV family protein n=1 Tax=Solemya velum gill symbiont TaxID=2340 RepID=UPI00118322E8|nr:cytochrome C oxidase subunit IV family protein [Solemya velum gill symbiont]